VSLPPSSSSTSFSAVASLSASHLYLHTILKLSGETLEEVILPSKKDLKGLKNIRGTMILWKYNKCAMPICKPEKPCWNIAYKRLFSR
jgi:hypothetical protein